MLPALLLTLAALAGKRVSATPVAADVLQARQGPFDFCSSLGTNIAAELLLGLDQLAGTAYCYSLLNVPKTTVSRTVTRTLTAISTISSTTTATSASVTVTGTVSTTVLATTTSGSNTTTVSTTGTVDAAPVVPKMARQANAKGKSPGNNPAQPTPANGSAKTRACSCILGVSPTQTLTQTLSATVSTTISTTRVITSTTAVGGSVNATITSTTTSTVTVPSSTASVTAAVHFTKQYPPSGTNSTANCGYTGATDQAGTSQQDCLNICANSPTCGVLFIQVSSGTFNCQLAPAPFSQASVVCNAATYPNVTEASGFSRGNTTTS